MQPSCQSSFDESRAHGVHPDIFGGELYAHVLRQLQNSTFSMWVRIEAVTKLDRLCRVPAELACKSKIILVSLRFVPYRWVRDVGVDGSKVHLHATQGDAASSVDAWNWQDYGHTCSRTIAALSAACPVALRLRNASTAAWHISIVPLTLTFMTVSHRSSKSASGRTFRAVTARDQCTAF